MKKLALLGSGENFVSDAVVKYFDGKDVDICLLSNDEHCNFFIKSKDAKLNVKYLPDEKTFEYFSARVFI